MELKGAACVVTGGAKGLGRALSEELKARGAHVIIGDLAPAIGEVISTSDFSGHACDVTEVKQVEELAQKAVEKFGKIDIWINNAGLWMPYASVEDLNFDRARKLIEVNYFGLAHGTIEAMKRMRPNKKGLIVNIISVRGLKGKALAAAYSASKFAAEGFTQAVRGELEGSGVKIIGVYPYRMKTELFGDNKHADYESSMEPIDVAKIIIENIAKESPAEHLEIWAKNDIRTSSL